MRVLLIHPPDNKYCIAPGRFEPLALEVLAATIPDHDTRIIDLRIDSLSRLDRQLELFQPLVAGISINNTIHVRQAIRILNRIRNSYPHVILIVGGHHPTMMPPDFHLPCVDYLFLGWAEKSFPEFIKCFSEGHPVDHIAGIEILDKGQVISRKENLWDLHPSEIPFPRRDLVYTYQNRYRSDMGCRTALVNTTRGCGNRCTFCSVWKATDGHFLIRNADDVFNEIAAIPGHIHRVFFADDNTFIRTDNAARLCQMIRDAGIKKKYSGYCRSDTIIRNPELMQAWKDIGLNNLCVGMEGTDNQILEKFNKKNNALSNEEAARILNEIGIPFRPHFLIDPAFELTDFMRVDAYVRKLRLNSPIFPILTPIPGSVYYEEMKNRISLDYDYFDYSHAVVPTRLSPSLFYKAWRRLFFRSYSVRRNLLCFFKRQIAMFTGNKRMKQLNYHYNLLNLFILKVVSIFLVIKLKKHCRALESGKLQIY